MKIRTPNSNKKATAPIIRQPEKTIWTVTKEFINNLRQKETFKRREILKYAYRNNNMIYTISILDIHTNLLLRAGFIKKSNKDWQYIKLYNIPEQLTTSYVVKLTDKNSWESWFTPISMINELFGEMNEKKNKTI